jgi:peptidoglycan hydrolase CwlO-like protein
VKNTQLLGVLKEEKALLNDKIAKCEDKCLKLEDLLVKSEAKLKLLNEQNVSQYETCSKCLFIMYRRS